jgi:hypothetical protein
MNDATDVILEQASYRNAVNNSRDGAVTEIPAWVVMVPGSFSGIVYDPSVLLDKLSTPGATATRVRRYRPVNRKTI